MTDEAMLPLDAAMAPPPPQPKRLREHRVRTLPSLLMALNDMLKWASDNDRAGPVNLADFDPHHGVTVSLNDDGTGLLFVKFDRHREAVDATPPPGAP